uniref:Nucleoside-diphosphate kinase n=1 Tax=Sphenodon punctatus TaxID=8508 RepID=A0A8D0G587_SPHPU
MQSLMEALLMHQPDDAVTFMINHLKLDNDEVPRIFVLGPPASGKTTLAKSLCTQLSTAYLTPLQLLFEPALRRSKEAWHYHQRHEKVPDELWVALLQDRLSDVDCVKMGWVLEGFPETREQATMLQKLGIAPRHVVVLQAPDTVLIERNLGKRLDPLTKEVYHTTFKWPDNPTVAVRLVVPEGISEQATAKRLLEYHRNVPGIMTTYQESLRSINADQPSVDVLAQALSFVQSWCHSAAPFTPRVLLLGPPGSGKSLQAALLAQKYRLADVCCGQLLKEAVAEKTRLGALIQPFFESGRPVGDRLVLHILKERLSRMDSTTSGWVLHGFPRDLDQAELLASAGFIPNRVFFLSLPAEVTMERICHRATDPCSGNRYHSTYKPAPTEGVRQRLRRNPKDDPERLEQQVEAYNRHVPDLEEFYEDAIYLNADQDPYTIFEYIESFLVHPLPTPLP